MYFTSLLAAAATVIGTASAAPSRNGNLAPLITPNDPRGLSVASAGESHIIEDSYIVVFKDSAHSDHHHSHKSQLSSVHAQENEYLSKRSIIGDAAARIWTGIKHEFSIGDFNGYTGHFGKDTLDWIRARDEVAFVEQDTRVYASEIEKGAPWGLARISHRKPLGFGTFNKYEYDGDGGEGVDVYVIDTGINIQHVEFEGRATWGKTMPQNDEDRDGNGHGTHVAGTIASRKYGVAKKANVIAVKVLGSNGSGTMSDVVGGVAWAAKAASSKDAAAIKSGNKAHKGSVANMSLGGGKSPALDTAVNNAVKKGLHFAVAAGNDNRDACTFSPAAAENAITVGASTISDEKAYFSNHGSCVDIFAPGLNILSTWNTGPNAINTISGTSMASPHIAGLAAYFLSLYPKTFVPSTADLAATEAFSTNSLGSVFKSIVDKGKQLVFGSPAPPAVAPKPDVPTTLHPKVLKAAMIRMASSGILTKLPDKTVNKLAFNNYTSAALILEEVLQDWSTITADE